MPQTNVISDWRATYPNDAPRQKPGGIKGTATSTASAASWANGVVTLTIPSTDYVGTSGPVTVAGFTPAGYNGSYQGLNASSATITYPLTANPGAATVMGTVAHIATVPLNVSTTLPANAVPNKPTYAAGTIQMLTEVKSEKPAVTAAKNNKVKPPSGMPPAARP
jgi:hypothetical protein